jgi:hypothetical protein
MLLAVDLMVRHTGEDIIDEEGIAVTSVLSSQSSGVNGAELDTPQANRLAADCYTAFSEKIFDNSVTEIAISSL